MADEDDVLDTSGDGFCHHIMNGGAIAQWQQLFGHRFGQWQHTGAKACDGDNGVGDVFHSDWLY